jgi:hypothetical protein
VASSPPLASPTVKAQLHRLTLKKNENASTLSFPVLDFDVRPTDSAPMYNTTIRPPGRFLRLRFLIPVFIFYAVWQLSLPAGRESAFSPWSFFRNSGNGTSGPGNQDYVPENTLKEPLDHDRNENQTVPEQKSIKEDEHVDQAQENLNREDQEIILEHKHADNVCGVLTGGERIVITVNTGATEVLERVPTQLRTSLLCAPNVYIYSDLGHTLGDHQVYNALDTTPASVMEGNSDFDIYRKQLELEDPVRVAEFLKGMKDPQSPGTLAAWTLDKYKKLHILEKVWDMQPDMDWYFHIDADTYVIWSSLVAWLEKLDPTQESFLGSLSFINNLPFAHGGSGMLLSGAAMRNFVVKHNGTANRWDFHMHDECCADWVLAQILKEYGMELMNSWPTIQGETQSTIPFDSTHWCQPLVTMHHVSPFEAAQMGDFEAKRENKTVSCKNTRCILNM